MSRALNETNRRREKQNRYNEENGITPQSIVKSIDATLISIVEADYFKIPIAMEEAEEYSVEKLHDTIARLQIEMRAAAARYEFEKAAELRDKIKHLRERELELG